MIYESYIVGKNYIFLERRFKETKFVKYHTKRNKDDSQSFLCMVFHLRRSVIFVQNKRWASQVTSHLTRLEKFLKRKRLDFLYMIKSQVKSKNVYIPATSAAVGRMFSQSGFIFRSHRTRMSSKTLQQLTLLKCNNEISSLYFFCQLVHLLIFIVELSRDICSLFQLVFFSFIYNRLGDLCLFVIQNGSTTC